MTIARKEKLIKPITDSAVLYYYLKVEELFDILHASHTAICHAGRDKMVTELNHKYCNITNQSIMVFLRFCPYCQRKNLIQKKA